MAKSPKKKKTKPKLSVEQKRTLKLKRDHIRSARAVFRIVYPKTLKDAERERFEAALILSINSNQTSAQAELRQEIDATRWTPDRAVPNRLLTVTYVNAFPITLRKIVGSGGPATFDALKGKLLGIDKFPFKTFHSSQYNRMAEKIYDKHFA